MKLIQGDCLEIMKEIPDGSVDLVLCDLPYGTTANIEWDKPITFEALWEQYNRIIKNNGAILLFSAQPFTTDLINSNRKMFRYEIVWQKTMSTGFLNANKMPLRAHENILVFYKHLPTYNPQKNKLSEEYIKEHMVNIGRTRRKKEGKACHYNAHSNAPLYTDTGERHPTDVIKFSNWNGALFGNTDKIVKHPTSKPVALLEYLIRTYTNEGETVLDNCMGSGSTGVACVNTRRDFIGIELDKGYFDIACKRIQEAQEKLKSEVNVLD